MLNTAPKKAQPSTRSQLIYKTLRVVRLNKKIFKKLLNDPRRGMEAVSRKKLHNSLQVKEQSVDGFNILTITASPAARKHIFFLHGGAYVAEANSGHRKLIEILVREYGYRVTFIDYPLAPEQNILTSLAVLEHAFKLLVKQYEKDEFCLMGDSAGGGLELNDPRLSPLFGDLDELKSIKVFVSTHELFYPDCILLLEKSATARNTYVDLTVKERMVHDWVILPLRERDEALKEAALFF